MRTNLESALTYASFGWEVFPCHKLSKIPIPKNGFHSATKDIVAIREMWKDHPDANVAIRIPKQHIVVDIDDPQLLGDLGTLPATIKVNTPRTGHGMHLWYTYPEGITLRRILSVVSGIDILTPAGYVIAPNSTHPSGGRYTWQVPPDESKPNFGIAEAPQWLIDLCSAEDPKLDVPKERLNMETILYNLKEGSRQEKLYQAACSMRGRNIRMEEAIALLEIAAANATPPYTERPVKDIVTRVYAKYQPNEKKKTQRIWKVSDLVKEDVGEISYFIDTLLPQGFTLFSADPKMGKSMILGNISKAIAQGKRALGKLETKKVGVLYLDLEQGEITGKQRWVNILGDEDPGDLLCTTYVWDKMDQGGMEQLEEFIRNNSEFKIVIIDILANFWPTEELVKGNVYQKEYAVIRKLADFAKRYGISIIGVHHNSKNNQSKDFIKSASGSMGMTAASDTIWVLDRTRNNDYAQLKVTGKNIKENVIYLQSYNDGFSWYAL